MSTLKVVSKTKTKSTEDFRAIFDKKFIVPNAIRAALKKLGNRGWAKEKEFCSNAGISINDIPKFRAEFEEFIVVAKEAGRHPTTVWCGSKAYATELREIVNDR